MRDANCVRVVTFIWFEDMNNFGHEAEEFFAARCRERGITPRRIRESRRPKAHRPDFAIQIDGKTVIVEVKAITPNKQDRDDLEKLTRYGYVNRSRQVCSDVDRISEKPKKAKDRKSKNPDVDRISEKLKESNGQLRPFARRGIPGIVNIVDYTGWDLFRVSASIHNAMFGRDKLLLSVPRDWRDYSDSPPPSRIESLRSAGYETLTPEYNTSVSALLIIHLKSPPDTFVYRLFHNHCARNPIPPECAARFVDFQYKSHEREGNPGDPWVKI